MDNKSRSFGETVRNTTMAGGQRIGHGIEGVRSRVGGRKTVRTERSGTDTAQDRESVPAANIPGNTSETGAGTPATGSGNTPRGTGLPSPLGRPAGCSAPTGALFIATVTMLGALRRSKHR